MTLQDYFIDHVQLKSEWAGNRNAVRPEELTVHSNQKVWWQCGREHTWQATVESRVDRGRGCPYCANQVVSPGETDLLTREPEMARLWHPTLNTDVKPGEVFPGSRKAVWWQCGQGHAWRAPVYSIKAGTACPYCAGRQVIPGETDLATTHPHVIPLWSPRNRLRPEAVTAGSKRKVAWICDRGHEWEAAVASVAVEGYGCPYCAGKLAIPGETDLATTRPDMLAQWDYERNTLDPKEILPFAHDKVWWRCELGHSWQAVVFSRTKDKGAGCPYCTGRKVLTGFNDLATLKPKVASEWYSPLNEGLSPGEVTLGSNKKVWWQCSDGHVWQAAIYSRTRKRGSGCPVCAGTVKQARGKK